VRHKILYIFHHTTTNSSSRVVSSVVVDDINILQMNEYRIYKNMSKPPTQQQQQQTYIDSARFTEQRERTERTRTHGENEAYENTCSWRNWISWQSTE